jgi:vacuolar-type H+-ATPase subunit F/Vma7
MLTNSTNPETLLLEDLPNLFSINLDTLDEKKLKNFLDKIEKLKSDIDLIYQNLLEQIISTCTKQINSYTNSNAKDLFTSIGELEAKESAKLEILQKQDKEFQRLLERFRFQYNSQEILAESIASIVCDAHPKYWKDHTLGEFTFKLTATLSKLHIANLMLNPTEGHTVKINRIVEEYKTLSKSQRLILRNELERVE